jgi:hypothetical protein
MRIMGILSLAAGLAAAGEPNGTDLVRSIEVAPVWRGRTGSDPTWFHPRAGVMPGKDGPVVVMTLQLITGSDVFHTVHWSRSEDLGKTWTKPEPIAGLGRVRTPDGLDDGVCDVVPEYHPQTGTFLAMGHNVYYRDGKLTRPSTDRHPVYVVGDGKGDWSERKVLAWDDPRASAMYTSNCGQRVVLANGDLLVPVSFGPRGRQDRAAGSLLCAFDGKTLTVKASTRHELRNTARRGLLEPSMVQFGGTFYLTIRAEDGRGYVAESSDGLEWTGTQPWAWEDGTPLDMSTTQQHWVAHSDGLYLAYTRKDASNPKVMRWRAPIWLARVNPEKRCLIRASERIAIPLAGDGRKGGVPSMGNFHVVAPTPDETWITVGECGPGFKGDTLLCRVQWTKPNRRVAKP